MSDVFLQTLNFINYVRKMHLKKYFGTRLCDFLEVVPFTDTDDEKVAFLIQMRLGPYLSTLNTDNLAPHALTLLNLVRESFHYRRKAAVRTTRLMNLCDVAFIPIKYSIRIGHKRFPTQERYFRDLDFAVERDAIAILHNFLAANDFFCGDIDNKDWSKYLVVSSEMLNAKLPNLREIHYFNVERIRNRTLERLIQQIPGAWRRLNELQFYSYVGDTFVMRHFLDISLLNSSAHSNEQPVDRYFSDLVIHAESDTQKKRVGINQVLELEEMISTRPLGVRSETINRICKFLYGTDTVSSLNADLTPSVMQGLLNFVDEKLPS